MTDATVQDNGFAADGKTPMYAFHGHPLMVRAVDFNALFGKSPPGSALELVQPTAGGQSHDSEWWQPRQAIPEGAMEGYRGACALDDGEMSTAIPCAHLGILLAAYDGAGAPATTVQGAKLLARASTLIREHALQIQSGHTRIDAPDDWTGEFQAKRDHDERHAVADALARWGNAIDAKEREENAAFEAWWRERQLKTFPKDYDRSRLENWGSAYKPVANEAWHARAARAGAVAQDSSLLDWLRETSCDLRSIDMPTGAGDAEVRWIVVEHHMAKPHEREIGRSFSDDPREAIRAAMTKEGGV